MSWYDFGVAHAGWQRDLSVSLLKIGDVLVAQGNLPEALVSFRAGLAIAERLAAADKGNAGWQRDVAVSNERIGDMHRRQGKTWCAPSTCLGPGLRDPEHVSIEYFARPETAT